MNEKTQNIFSIALKAGLIVLVAVGVYFSMTGRGFMSGGSALLFFTIQSNLIIAGVIAVYLFKQIYEMTTGKRVEFPSWFYMVKFAFSVAILVTLVVFWVLLAPQMVAFGKSSYLVSPNNLFLHTFVPIMALVDLFVFDLKHLKLKKFSFLYGLVMPLLYLPFAMICAELGVVFSVTDAGVSSHFPYFFLDYTANGWFSIGDGKLGVFYWIIIVALVVIAISFLLSVVIKKFQKKQLEK